MILLVYQAKRSLNIKFHLRVSGSARCCPTSKEEAARSFGSAEEGPWGLRPAMMTGHYI